MNLKKRIIAVNELNNFLNITIPELIEQLKKGYKLKKDNSFHKKDSDILNAIIKKNCPSYIRCYFDCSDYFISLKTDIRYSNDNHTNYIDNWIVLVGPDNKPIDYKLKKINFNFDEISIIKNIIELNEDEIERLKDINRKLINNTDKILKG